MLIGPRAFRLLWRQKKEKRKGPFLHVLGAICVTEIARSGADWHPHMHCVVTLPRGKRIDVRELRTSWEQLTLGRQIRIDPLRGRKGLLEAFKYVTKPQDLSGGKIDLEALWWRFLTHKGIKGQRLIRSLGCYFGQDQEPDLAGAELPDSPGDYLDWLATWAESPGKYELEKAPNYATT
jgi:hypothetical protein